jgi:hypothetical protein
VELAVFVAGWSRGLPGQPRRSPRKPAVCAAAVSASRHANAVLVCRRRVTRMPPSWYTSLAQAGEKRAVMVAVAILKRRLREGKTYGDFRRAWFHDTGGGMIVTVDRPLTDGRRSLLCVGSEQALSRSRVACGLMRSPPTT